MAINAIALALALTAVCLALSKTNARAVVTIIGVETPGGDVFFETSGGSLDISALDFILSDRRQV